MIQFPDLAGLHIANRTPEGFELDVGPDCSEATFLRLLFWLPPRHELFFYDQFFPGTANDPGAYVAVQRRADWFLNSLGNHGWSQAWAPQSPNLIAAWMALNLKAKAANPEPLRRLRIREAADLPEAFTRDGRRGG